jgi:uncharacterized protein YciI
MSDSEMPSGVELEDVYLVEAMYLPGAAEKRSTVRGPHLTRIAELTATGTIIEAGAFKDVSSSILIVRAENEAAAVAIAQADVYVTAGVWGEITARPFGRVKT